MLVISLATYHQRNIQQLDVKTAFLNGDLQEEVLMGEDQGNETLYRQMVENNLPQSTLV